MDSYFDNYCDSSAQHVSPSGRTLAPTNYPYSFNPHEPCSYCFDPYHSASSCPSWEQFCNLSYEQMNTNLSSPGFDSNSNFYNPDWSDHPDFSWQAQAMGNCAPQFQELHYPDYPQFDNQSSYPSSYVYLASSSQSTLEDTLKVFMELTGQAISDVKNATMENTQAIAKIEGKLEYLVAEVTRIEEEELQSQSMVAGHYMIDEDDASHSCHEHVPTITMFENEEIVDSNEEEKEEHLEQAAPPPNPNTSNNKEMSTEAQSFITIPLETFHELQASILKCLKEPSYAKTVKDLCTQPRKSRNLRPKKILRSKQVGYIRWRNIPPEGHQFLKKKGWKGLVGHPHDRGRRCKFSFTFLYS
jgi:hypothetical protein